MKKIQNFRCGKNARMLGRIAWLNCIENLSFKINTDPAELSQRQSASTVIQLRFVCKLSMAAKGRRRMDVLCRKSKR